MTRVALLWTLVLAALAGLATSASADLPEPGPNGLVAFTSGRDDGATVLSDNLAQIWTTGPLGGGATRLSTETMADTTHHRHATWSPDRTKVAFARGAAFAGPYDIYVRDLLTGSTVALAVTDETEDRPAWSPDGTRIAYQVDLDNDPLVADWAIQTRLVTGGAPTTVASAIDTTVTNGGFYPRPHWTPDSQTIFYTRLDGGDLHDIYRSPANGTNPAGTVVVNGATNDYQPEVSPAGDRICFTRDIAADKDVFVAPISGASPTSLGAGGVDYECGWSPDTTRILFSRGGFGAGMLMARDSDGTGLVSTLANDVGNNRFDGNGDWTYNPSPTCANGAASVGFNFFASIPLSCSDQPDPPSFAPNSPFGPDIVTPPAHGVLGGISNDSVIYTPNVNFQGQDSFTFKSDDGTSDSTPATIAITVAGPVVNPPGAATVEALTVVPRRWRRGSALPRVSQAPVGTRIGVRLSAAGRVTLTFRRARPGRRVRGRCVRPTVLNRNRRRCTRYVRVRPSLRFDGKQGANSMRFQGRLNARKRLALGRYRVSARVTAGGQTSPSRTVSFRIVRR